MENLSAHIRLRLESQILETCKDICGATPDFSCISQREPELRDLYRVAARVVGSYIQNVNDTAFINRLPAELLCHVASYLPRYQLGNMLQTCRAWNSILTLCSTLWNVVGWICFKRQHPGVLGDGRALDNALSKAKLPRLLLDLPDTSSEDISESFIRQDIRLWPLYAYRAALFKAAPRMRSLSIFAPKASSLTALFLHLPAFPLLDKLTITSADAARLAPDIFAKGLRKTDHKVKSIRRLVMRGFIMRPVVAALTQLDFPQLENLELELKHVVAASSICGLLNMLPALKRISIHLAENIRYIDDADLQPRRLQPPRNFDYVLVSEATTGARQILQLLQQRHILRHASLEWTAYSDEHPYHLFDHPSGEWVSLALTLRNKGLVLDCTAVDSSGMTRSVLWRTKNNRMGERTTSYSHWRCRELFRHLSPSHLKIIRVNHNHWPALSEGMLASELETLVVHLSPFDDELMLLGTTALPKLRTVRFELGQDESPAPVEVGVLTTFLRGLSCGGKDNALIPRVELDRWTRLDHQDLRLVQALAEEIVVEN